MTEDPLHLEGPHDCRALADLIDESGRYVAALILAAFQGAAEDMRSLGRLEKAESEGRLAKYFGRLGGFVGRKLDDIPVSFRTRKLKRSMTPKRWDAFGRRIGEIMRPHLDGIAEETAVKSVLLGLSSLQRETESQEALLEDYPTVESKLFQGYMPDTIRSGLERYDMKTVRRAMDEAHDRAAMHVTRIPEKIRDAVREQVSAYVRSGKDDPRELASNLFHIKDDRPDLKSHTAEQLSRDWHRVANTEIARWYATARQSAREGEAEASMRDPSRAVHVVFHGTGQCDWCRPRQGTIMRQAPLSAVKDPMNDSLKSMGIDDPHTDIATWIGKNNVGLKKAQWRVCGSAHPNCGCVESPIDPRTQEYDRERNVIRFKSEATADRYIPPDILKEMDDMRARARLRRDRAEADRASGKHVRNAAYYGNWRKRSE